MRLPRTSAMSSVNGQECVPSSKREAIYTHSILFSVQKRRTRARTYRALSMRFMRYERERNVSRVYMQADCEYMCAMQLHVGASQLHDTTKLTDAVLMHVHEPLLHVASSALRLMEAVLSQRNGTTLAWVAARRSSSQLHARGGDLQHVLSARSVMARRTCAISFSFDEVMIHHRKSIVHEHRSHKHCSKKNN